VFDGAFGPLPAKDVTLPFAKPHAGIEALRMPATLVEANTWRMDGAVIPAPCVYRKSDSAISNAVPAEAGTTPTHQVSGRLMIEAVRTVEGDGFSLFLIAAVGHKPALCCLNDHLIRKSGPAAPKSGD
jgi:hypothetical protein